MTLQTCMQVVPGKISAIMLYFSWFFQFPLGKCQGTSITSFQILSKDSGLRETTCPTRECQLRIRGFPIYSIWYTSYSAGTNPWYNQRPYSPTENHTIVPHRHLPCIKMPQHNLAENVNQYFILKFINAQNVEVAHKSWGNNVSTLADNTHGTYQLHNKTCFDDHIWGRL